MLAITVFPLFFTLSNCYTNMLFTDYKCRNGTKLQTFYKTLTALTKMECCRYCSLEAQCASASFSQTGQQCDLSTLLWVEVPLDATSDPEWSVFSKNDYGWYLAFRGTPGIGGEPYLSWLYATNYSTSDVTCHLVNTSACTLYYRSPIIDLWTEASVMKVKLSFWKSGSIDAYVTFNSKAKNATKWFVYKRIIDSSWRTIKSETSFAKFALRGVPRNFVINILTTCGGQSYSQTIWKPIGSCKQDIQTSYPQFLYSSGTSSGDPHNWIGFERADAVTIHIM